MLLRKHVRKITLLVMLLGLFRFILVPMLVYNNNGKRDLDVKGSNEARRPLCIHMNPPVKKDEFHPANRNEELKRICPGEYKEFSAWDVNVNVNRTYSFRPAKSTDTIKPTTPPMLDRISSLIFIKQIEQQKPTIPKILHFVWTDEVIPSIFVDNLRLFRKTHPSWTMNFWTFRAGREFIKKHEPQFLSTFNNYGKDVFRGDTLRYVLMYHIGGAYFDLDSKVVQPLDALIGSHDCIIGPEPIENAVSILGMRSLLANSGFLCKPGHPFFRHLIDGLLPYGTNNPGPVYFTKGFTSFLGSQLDVRKVSTNTANYDITVVPHDYFEYNVNKGVDKIMKKKCVAYDAPVRKFLSDCLHTAGKPSPECESIYGKVPARKKKDFEACVEWIQHGKDKRGPSSNRFIEHEHYGTYDRMNTLVYKNENNISRILPDISLHL